MMLPIKTTKNEEGSTFLEFLLSFAIFLMILGGMCTLLIEGQRISAGQTDFLRMHQNTRSAMDLMSREILMAGFDPLNPVYPFTRLPPVLDPSDTSVRILADLNLDGDANDADENIYYEWDSSSGEITRDTGSGGFLIAKNISAFSFVYRKGATILSGTASTGATILSVASAAGFEVGDSIYISDGVNTDNSFISAISVNNLTISPALTIGYAADSTVASLDEIVLSITGQTEEEDPQIDAFRSITLTESIAIRNSDI